MKDFKGILEIIVKIDKNSFFKIEKEKTYIVFNGKKSPLSLLKVNTPLELIGKETNLNEKSVFSCVDYLALNTLKSFNRDMPNFFDKVDNFIPETTVNFTHKKDIWKTLRLNQSDDPTRFFMNGINWNLENGEFCSTDGRRLVKTFLNTPRYISGKPSCIIPNNALEKYCSSYNIQEYGTKDYIEPWLISSYIEEFNASIFFLSILGNFPNYGRVIPESRKDYTAQWVIPTMKELKEMKSRIKLIKGSHYIYSVDGSLISKEGIDFGSTNKLPHKFGFNIDFLIDCLNSGIGVLSISPENIGKPALYDNGEILQLVMPVNWDNRNN